MPDLFGGPFTGSVEAAMIQSLADLDGKMNAVEQSIRKVNEVSDAATLIAGSYRDATGRLRDEHGRFISQARQAAVVIAATGESTQAAAVETDRYDRALGAVNRSLSTTERGLRGASAAFSTVESTVTRAIAAYRSIAELSAEQTLLNRATAETGINYRALSDHLGRFTSETDLATNAMRLHERGTNATREQYEALANQAGLLSEATGVAMPEALHQMDEWVMRGSQRIGSHLSPALRAWSGNLHTAEERLHALEAVNRTAATASDDASTSFERASNQAERAERAFSSSFTESASQAGGLNSQLSGIVGNVNELETAAHGAGRAFAWVTGLVAQAERLNPVLWAWRYNVWVLSKLGGNANATMANLVQQGAPAAGTAVEGASEDGEETPQQRTAREREEHRRQQEEHHAQQANDHLQARGLQRLLRGYREDVSSHNYAALTGSANGTQLAESIQAQIRRQASDPIAADDAIEALQTSLTQSTARHAQQLGRAGASAAQRWLHGIEQHIHDHPTDAGYVVGGHLSDTIVAGIRAHFTPTKARELIDHLNHQMDHASRERLAHLMEQAQQTRIQVPSADREAEDTTSMEGLTYAQQTARGQRDADLSPGARASVRSSTTRTTRATERLPQGRPSGTGHGTTRKRSTTTA